MKKIVWLSSYPKSGNTWMRSFLTYLLNGATENTINNLIAPIVSGRTRLEEFLMLETSELTNDELEKYTPAILREFAGEVSETPYFMKVHDAYVHTSDGVPFFPADISIGAVYIIRNPLDVVPSFAHHNNSTIENTVKIINDKNFCFCNDRNTIKSQVRQRVLNWSDNARSWLQQSDIPVIPIRYEDMLMSPLATFRKVVDFCGITATDEQILTACEEVSFENLQKQEKQFGFSNKKYGARSFFRKGKIGSWRESLTDEQAQSVIDAHCDVMRKFGYLTAEGTPVY
jgi:5'(3')-deoxyribonucleotidase